MSGTIGGTRRWPLVPTRLQAMLKEADLELARIAGASKTDAERLARMPATVERLPASVLRIGSLAECDALDPQGAAFDDAERAHGQALEWHHEAVQALSTARLEEAQFAGMMSKAKLWRLVLLAVFVALVAGLLW